ncbi:hypothetical protein, partial [Mesorhizobium sp.]|uniref:hypothetical protein n=1 Tax=Mesorhizobium sp. TaxID=1871066 RepID=UPI0025CCEBB7
RLDQGDYPLWMAATAKARLCHLGMTEIQRRGKSMPRQDLQQAEALMSDWRGHELVRTGSRSAAA